MEYTEGVCNDGAAILQEGEQITISEILTELNKVADLEAQVAELRIATEMLLCSVENDVSKSEFDMTVRNAKEAVAKIGS